MGRFPARQCVPTPYCRSWGGLTCLPMLMILSRRWLEYLALLTVPLCLCSTVLNPSLYVPRLPGKIIVNALTFDPQMFPPFPHGNAELHETTVQGEAESFGTVAQSNCDAYRLSISESSNAPTALLSAGISGALGVPSLRIKHPPRYQAS